jgi:hypothetical protein
MSPDPGTAAVRSSQKRGNPMLAVTYSVLSVVGLVGTWYFNLRFAGGNFVADWFASPASSSAAVDVIVTASAACIFFVVEGWRIGWKWSAILIPLTFALALAFTFPLFLAIREGLRIRAARRTP